MIDPLHPAPVPFRARADGWSPARQWQFIQALGDTACVAEAARLTGMSQTSVYRLRRHPDARDFRMAWDMALHLAWQRVEQTALARVLNGDIFEHERDGVVVARRRKPCSDRLTIFMLQEQLRRVEAQAVDYEARLHAAKTAAARAGQGFDPAAVMDPISETTDICIMLHDITQNFPDRSGWDVAADDLAAADLAGAVPAVPTAERLLAPDSGALCLRSRAATLRDPEAKRRRGEARAAAQIRAMEAAWHREAAAVDQHDAAAAQEAAQSAARKVSDSPPGANFPDAANAGSSRFGGGWQPDVRPEPRVRMP